MTTVNELSEEKEKLRQAIERLIIDFEKQCPFVMVDRLDVDRIDAHRLSDVRQYRIPSVSVEVKLT